MRTYVRKYGYTYVRMYVCTYVRMYLVPLYPVFNITKHTKHNGSLMNILLDWSAFDRNGHCGKKGAVFHPIDFGCGRLGGPICSLSIFTLILILLLILILILYMDSIDCLLIAYCLFPFRQTLFFTATWPNSVRKLAAEFLGRAYTVTIGNRDELKGNQEH